MIQINDLGSGGAGYELVLSGGDYKSQFRLSHTELEALRDGLDEVVG